MSGENMLYLGHICSGSGVSSEQNKFIAFEIIRLAKELKENGFDETPSERKYEDFGGDVTSASSVDHFRELVRAYINRTRGWNYEGQLSSIYKAYFTGQGGRFSVVDLAGDIIVVKMNLEKSINEDFAASWFRGVLDLIVECVKIE
jgi:hypothetical protein